MALNIKNERVHELARQAAQVRGTTQTSALEAALEEYLARHGATEGAAEGRFERATVLVQQIRNGLSLDDGESLSADLADLYDEQGLPR
ncbi:MULTISPECIES: type II toxin-antitoxin system VapB family antitoxin [Kytococcus]|uniref:Antitoxin n=1 Tax=Kytococcus schroeteri TaxID=138300 RepID=A0A2I1PBP9_9MICO|nr:MULTISPECIES: type II toxin-antitoxin system VapB family antitoxin [Kytococcus]OFS13861.1 hypothetical protein HMPREF3099_05295 [Kytococcus sp. HMSC28H12]PKZ42053.1 hypothetical protein CYJ76_04190 [Kytococcus schroeteri]